MDQWINCKGSDCTLIKGFWISYGMSRFRTTTGVEHCTGLAWCQVFWLDVLMYPHEIWLDPKYGATLYELVSSFTNGYGLLAAYAMESQQCLYAIKPKMHFYPHILLDIKQQLDNKCIAILSPVIFDCQQDEDQIGRLCKLSRQVDSRVLMRRTLEFYLVTSSILCRRHLKRCRWGPHCRATPVGSNA